MSKSPKDKDFVDEDDDNLAEDEYDEMELLERLETLREDMEDLGVTTLGEVIERIDELHRRLDAKHAQPIEERQASGGENDHPSKGT
jgi:hypothetical protein